MSSRHDVRVVRELDGVPDLVPPREPTASRCRIVFLARLPGLLIYGERIDRRPAIVFTPLSHVSEEVAHPEREIRRARPLAQHAIGYETGVDADVRSLLRSANG